MRLWDRYELVVCGAMGCYGRVGADSNWLRRVSRLEQARSMSSLHHWRRHPHSTAYCCVLIE